MFEGSYVALITPMATDGAIDEAALRGLVKRHIELGTNGIVPVGTTGESPVLTHEEHARVVTIVVEESAGALPVIAGCGSNNTAEAVDFHKHAHAVGADAALHVTGYYNRPSQEGIYQHFASLGKENDLPIIVYNIPARAVVDISVETLSRLAELESVAGVKDSTRDLTRPHHERAVAGPHFSLLSGEDASAVAYNAAGGNGCISVTANVAPEHCARMQRACIENDFHQAMSIQRELMPLHDALCIEPSPVGIKYACARIGLCEETVRLPMVSLEESTRIKIDQALQSLNLV